MEDIVAVEVRLSSGGNLYCLTWGRIQDPVDPGPLAELILNRAHSRTGADPVSARVLWSLHPAMQAPNFFESFFDMSQTKIPFGKKNKNWRKKMAKRMNRGHEIWWLGEYIVPIQPDEPDAVKIEDQ